MDRPTIEFAGPILDTVDVPELTRFYARFLGWEAETLEERQPDGPPGTGMTRLTPPGGGMPLEIQYDANHQPPNWPSLPGGQVKQIHLDFHVADLPSGVAWAIECGAREADPQPTDRNLDRLRVLIDPAGHPFCLFG